MPGLGSGGSHRRGRQPVLQLGQSSDNRNRRDPQQPPPLLQLRKALQHPQTGKPHAMTWHHVSCKCGL